VAHSYFSGEYDLVTETPTEDRSDGGFRYVWPKAEWVIFHHNSSRPNNDVTIVLRSIDGKRLEEDDPRRTEVKLPFGLLAEFVGFRVLRDRAEAAERCDPRTVLGLLHQE
jgi:hypothetical protein